MIQRLGTCVRKGRELCLFPLGKRRLGGDLVTVFWCFKSGYKEDGDSLSARSDMEKTSSAGHIIPGEILAGLKRKIFHDMDNQLWE